MLFFRHFLKLSYLRHSKKGKSFVIPILLTRKPSGRESWRGSQGVGVNPALLPVEIIPSSSRTKQGTGLCWPEWMVGATVGHQPLH